ncbi:VOC family protein [Nonomuraea phyllanthi]|uniref:hypothetical protein n=1 Tax=Nonomuraea phyllanthi TaxID=2219224 RepID=UPI001D006550|nr:hypothetical protein [Nonomuraea phyllanthi]
MNALPHDVAHLGHTEPLTPEPERSLWFFTEMDSGRISAQWLHFANKSYDVVFIETGPHKHAIQQTFFLYAYEPGGNRPRASPCPPAHPGDFRIDGRAGTGYRRLIS